MSDKKYPALDYFKDNVPWDDMRPIGQCILLADEAGNHDVAEAAAIHLMQLWSFLNITYKDNEKLINELKKKLNDLNDESPYGTIS